jgi:serine/threonine protein kinase
MAACQCLIDAKDAGISHGCLAPSQIFLEHAEQGEIAVRVLGFGCSNIALKVLRQNIPLKRPDFLSYAAPELSQPDQPITQRSEVWSASLTLYFALAGTNPLGDIPNVPTSKLPDIQDVAPWIEAGLAQIVHANLGPNPDSRCPSLALFAEALRRFCAGSERVTTATLLGVPPQFRATDAARVLAPSCWNEVRTNLFPPASADDPLVGDTLNCRYALVRLVGKGGMGAVYEALAPNGSRVAVKAILDDSLGGNENLLRRFMREARVLSSLKAPNVVRILEVGTDSRSSIPYIAMEYLNGRDLSSVIKEQGALDEPAVIRLFVQVCAGVSAAHERAIVHRDIKPANIFLHEL